MSNPATPAPPQRREEVFCHQCRMEWYRDEHGLVCPRCGGDFVEIVEERDDPSVAAPLHGMPDLIGGSDDEDEDEPSAGLGGVFPPGVRVMGSGFGGFPMPGHGVHTPGTPGGGQPLSELLNVLLGVLSDSGRLGATSPGQTPGAERTERQAAGADAAPTEEQQQGYGSGVGGAGGWGRSPPGSPIHISEHRVYQGPGISISTRFNYNSNAHAPGPFPFPTGERPQNRRSDTEPRVENLPTLLARMFGPPPGADGDNDPVTQDLFARLMGIVQPSGDYVFSQNDFDRLMTDLMEQHQGNAPPPAKKEVLDHLPKIKVTEEMVLSNEDCAVCKEELVIDEELVKLPCNHHYHELCVRKWLESHDTCPICRRPTSDHGNGNNNSSSSDHPNLTANPSNDNRNASRTTSSSQSSPNRQEQSIPGAWPSWLSRSSGSNDRGGT